MASRPLLSIGIEELERRFDVQRSDAPFLKQLVSELEHRKVPRAKHLKERAVQALGVAPKSVGKTSGTATRPPETRTPREPRSRVEASRPG